MKWTVEILKTVQDPKSFKLSSEVVGTVLYDERGRPVTANAPMLKAMDLRLIGKWLRQGTVEGITATVGYMWRAKPEEQAFAESARQIIEAETPKKALRSLTKGQIKPGRGYWLNIANADQPWEDGEFCPAEICPVNQLNTLDGLYGLTDDVIKALERAQPGFNWESPEGEERYVQELDRYEEPIWANVRRGITSGTINGIDGPKKWQIVFQRSSDKLYNERFFDPRPVEPGVDYATESMLNQEAENPKKAMRYMRPRTQISGQHIDVGSVEIVIEFSNGVESTATIPIVWAKWQDDVTIDLPIEPPDGISEDRWKHVIEVVEYGLNEGFNSADHEYFEEENVDAPGEPHIARMYWKILGLYDNGQLRRHAYRKLFPMMAD